MERMYSPNMTYAYDKLNRVVTVTDSYDKVISRKIYDANGNILKEIDSKGYLSGSNDNSRYGTLYTYDLANRLVTRATPEAAAQDKISMKYSYNQYGEVVKQTDSLGNATAYEYDAGGRLTKVTDPLGVATKYSYDKQGNKLTMTDGRRKLTRYSYTASGNLKTVTNPDSKAITYKYDLMGSAVCITDKNGNDTIYTYNNRGLMLKRKATRTSESKPGEDTSGNSGDSISYTYDEAGNRISMADESGTSTYSYDGNNRLLEIKKGKSTQISYDYDQVGNVTKVTDLKGNTTAYTYDKSNRMETVAVAGKTTTYSYDENGRRSAVTYAGGVSEKYSYDKDNQLKSLINKKANGVIISEYNYIYDLAGRQTSKTDSFGTTSYTYDKAGRITKISTPGKTTVYAYDNAGNRISQNETYKSQQSSGYVDEATGKDIQYILKKSDYTYSSSNTLLKLVERMLDESNKELARKTTKYVYDDNGNQLRQSISYVLPDNTKLRPSSKGTAYGENMSGDIDKLVEKTSYVYDGFNRLKKTETVKEGVRTTAEYIYNGDDLRVSKTVKKSDKGYKAEITNYLYDRQNVILETDAKNNVKARYIKGINYISKIDASNKEAYYLFNGHGDVVQTVDEAGTLQNQYDYDIWGNPTLTIETAENAIRYSGEFMDSETGLYYLRARYYDSYTGRFTSEDSYWGEDENPLSLNLYTYCENDPIQYIDPSGHNKTLYQEADVSMWSKGSSKATFSINGTTQDLYLEKDGKVYDSHGYVRGTTENGHIVVSDKEYTNLFGNNTGGSTPTTVNVDKGQNVTSIVTGTGSNVTINNSGSLKTLTTGTNSFTTVNNYSIIDTMTSGKGSSLVLNNSGTVKNVNVGENANATIINSENHSITNIIAGKDSQMNITNSGQINYIRTGDYSNNSINNEGYGHVDWLETGLDNESIINNDRSFSNMTGWGQVLVASNTTSIPKQIEDYLVKLGFTIVSKDTSKSTNATEKSSALIIVQWYLIASGINKKIKINGSFNDSSTLTELKTLYDTAKKDGKDPKEVAKEILGYADEHWQPEKPTIDKDNKSDYAKNGKYDLLKDRLVAIPTGDGKGGYLERNTAVTWAMMIQEAVEYNSGKNKPFGTVDIGRFMPNWENGFRSIERQEYFWEKYNHDSSRAARPGTSNHGWGLAIDFRFTDPQEGKAVSNELRWLEALTKPKDSKFHKFIPNLHSQDVSKYKTRKDGTKYPNPKYGSPTFKDGSYNYYETWHWSYYTKL